ncbi:ABC transporter ATP-binding protein, partial [Streptomyces sp. SID14478]|uniref:AAA family ATPase n=1 Tax=Streptomyces sp. SID14478 TaxID=2706073 RepID=UPI00141129BC|nr:ABC transporter ATP-binding protein [Streptomyces sp. SID14478]
LGIAAALLGDPDVVLLDEPSNGLDAEGIVWIREVLRDLAREGRTVLVSSHLMNETATFADHLVVLGRGRLLADTSMPDFLARYATRSVRVRTTEPDRLRAALARAGHTVGPTADGRCTVAGASAADVGALAAADEIPLLELADDQPSLEEAYLALTAHAAEFAAVPLQEA